MKNQNSGSYHDLLVRVCSSGLVGGFHDVSLNRREVLGLGEKIRMLIEREVLDQLPRKVTNSLKEADLIYLRELQKAIYELDYYGEQTYKLSQNVIGRIWNRILGVVKDKPYIRALVLPELDRLKAYQEFEEQIHNGRFPTYLEGIEALELKSSDIMLLKKVAIWLSGNHQELTNIELHREIARQREIFDDLADMREDVGTWNFNLFFALNHAYPVPKPTLKAFDLQNVGPELIIPVPNIQDLIVVSNRSLSSTKELIKPLNLL